MSAEPDFGKVILSWITESELENMGFNIYRSSSDAPDDFIKINDYLIAGNGTTTEQSEYNDLWDALTEATEFHTVTVPDTDGVDFTFTAYFSGVSRKLRKWKDSETFWKEMTVRFTAQSPKATP